jgi:hypothetical protein
MKYVILCDSNNVEPFKIPRQLSKIGNETIVERTIRQLKENDIKDIIVTSHDKRFDNLEAERYEPKSNSYKGAEQKGCWIDAFTVELITEPIVFLFGDVFYSNDVIKTIVESETDDVLFFCTDISKGKDKRYIKEHDEPLGYKIVNIERFKEHQSRIRDLYYSGKIERAIAWELYRSLNNLPLDQHKLTQNYIGINDITCDIDNVEDVKLIEEMANKTFMRVKAVINFTDNQDDIKRKKNDIFIVEANRGKQLLGNNEKNTIFVELLEIFKSEI